MPDTAELCSQSGCTVLKITQTYLGNNSRIRLIEENGKLSYVKTVKEKVSEMTRLETEGEITKGEYTELLASADPKRNTVHKVRYRIPHNGKLLEIDIFDFWSDRAFLEIELESEAEAFSIPDYLKVIREVTLDKRYRNSALALQVPYDEI